MLTVHSEKEGATGNYEGGFGFHPLMAYPDCPDSAAGGMPLAGLLRPGNAGANTAADHTRVLADALEQLPRELCESAEIVMRTDSAGATHELLEFCHDGRIRFSVDYDRPYRGRPRSNRRVLRPGRYRSARRRHASDGARRHHAHPPRLSV
ncbi:MAG: transposase [Actinomycetota bacterium]|nr:transposase [Actinomycetota bacterium]